MSARHRTTAGEPTTLPVEPARRGSARTAPRPTDTRTIGVPRALRGGGRPAATTPKTPLLLRVTVGVALLAAVGASMMRDHLDLGQVAGDALRLVPLTHSSAPAAPQVINLQAVGAHSGTRTSSARGASTMQASGGMGTSTGRPRTAVTVASRVRRGSGCQVKYAMTNQANGQSAVVVTVGNLSTRPVQGWVVRWPVASDQELADGWGAGLEHAGGDAIATDAGFNKMIPVGGQVSFGFSGWNLKPASSSRFTLNGVMCR